MISGQKHSDVKSRPLSVVLCCLLPQNGHNKNSQKAFLPFSIATSDNLRQGPLVYALSLQPQIRPCSYTATTHLPTDSRASIIQHLKFFDLLDYLSMAHFSGCEPCDPKMSLCHMHGPGDLRGTGVGWAVVAHVKVKYSFKMLDGTPKTGSEVQH